MTTVKEKLSIFDDEISQEDTGSKRTDSSESDNFGIDNDIEMLSNQDDNPTTTMITNTSNPPTSVITENAIYEYIHRDYFVDPKNQEKNNTWRIS